MRCDWNASGPSEQVISKVPIPFCKFQSWKNSNQLFVACDTWCCADLKVIKWIEYSPGVNTMEVFVQQVVVVGCCRMIKLFQKCACYFCDRLQVQSVIIYLFPLMAPALFSSNYNKKLQWTVGGAFLSCTQEGFCTELLALGFTPQLIPPPLHHPFPHHILPALLSLLPHLHPNFPHEQSTFKMEQQIWSNFPLYLQIQEWRKSSIG